MAGNPVYQTVAWKNVAKQTLLRDGYECQIRLPGCLGTATSADHRVELEDGGAPYDLANLQAACVACNTAKRNRSLALRAKGRPLPLRQW